MPGEPNPYEAPRADIGLGTDALPRRTGWKLYAWAVVVIQLVGLGFDLQRITVTAVLDDFVTVVAMLGLLGYAYRRAFWGQQIWMLWAVLFPMSNAAIGMWVYPQQNGTGARIGYFVAMLLLSPQYWAVIRYAYRSPEVWYKAAGRGKVRGDI